MVDGLLLEGFFLVTIEGTGLKEGIEAAKKKAKEINKPVLVSEVNKINIVNSLSFFVAGTETYKGERFFWKDPSDEYHIVGLGICKKFESDQDTDRFFHVEREWKRFIDDAFIHNPYRTTGIGPTMFGSFSFDPLKRETGMWSNFSDAFFYLPKFMLTMVNGKVFLTTNVIITHEDDHILDQIMKQRNTLFSKIKEDFLIEETELIDKLEVTKNTWITNVNKVTEVLNNDSLKKVVLARELRLIFNKPIQTENVLFRLLEEQRPSYIFAFESRSDCFIGASPERLVKKKGKQVFSTCLAGSTKRGKTLMEDKNFGDALLTDKKNIMEHQIVVDMIKDAMNSVCDNVTIPDHPELLKMRDIQHLYTPVIGELQEDKSLFLLMDLLHPTPALGGFPQKMAMAKIREMEDMDRGLYGGPIGWTDYLGNGEFAVSIRSGLIQGNEASIFAGCGIVANSVAESEFEETRIKFRPMLSALGGIIDESPR